MIKQVFKLFTKPAFYVALIVLLGFYVRLYKIENPVADWHSWRQADTAAVSRNFFKEGFNPLYPTYDDMSAVSETSQINVNRYRFVEFPIYNSIVYFAYQMNGKVDERLARLVSVFFSLGSIIFIYLITKRYFNAATSLMAAFLFAILPFNIYFSRVILPEPALVFFCLGMFYFLDRWIFENSLKLYFLSLFFTIAAFLIKPMAIFYLPPLFYSFFQKEKRLWPIPKRYFLLAIPAILPLLGWRYWINQHPDGIPRSSWLLNGNGIRFRPAFFRWILGDRFAREILSVTGTLLLSIGLLVKPNLKEGWLLHLLAISSFAFLVVFATGNVQHDYYQTLIVPALVIFVARGFMSLIEGIPGFIPRLWTIPLAIFFLSLALVLTWYEVRGLYQINNWAIVEAGIRADQLLPKNAIVLAPYGGDSAFLYQTNRPGFPFIILPIQEMIEKYGVSYFVSVNFDAKTKWLMSKYEIVEQTPKYVIINLTKINPNFYHSASNSATLTEPP